MAKLLQRPLPDALTEPDKCRFEEIVAVEMVTVLVQRLDRVFRRDGLPACFSHQAAHFEAAARRSLGARSGL